MSDTKRYGQMYFLETYRKVFAGLQYLIRYKKVNRNDLFAIVACTAAFRIRKGSGLYVLVVRRVVRLVRNAWYSRLYRDCLYFEISQNAFITKSQEYIVASKKGFHQKMFWLRPLVIKGLPLSLEVGLRKPSA